MSKEDTSMRPGRVISALVLAILTVTPAQAAGPGAACSAIKDKAVGKDAFDQMKCYATAAIRGTLDPPCIQKAVAKLTAAFARAEQTGGCPAVGDTGLLEGQVDEFVGGAVFALPTVTTTTVPTFPPPCPGGGASAGSTCWYAGTAGQTCDQVCAAVGRTYDPKTATYAGSDGADVDCLTVLGVLNHMPLDQLNVLFTGRSEDCAAVGLPGLGCFASAAPGGGMASFGRCAAPLTTASASASGYARYCACQ